MACGCNKKVPRRFAPPRNNVRQNGQIRAAANNINNGSTVNALNVQKNRDNKLNQGGINAEKRKIQAIRRKEILRRFGKG